MTALIQYFLLAAFCWMLCEGVMLYLKVVVVFSDISKKWWFFCLLGWGMYMYKSVIETRQMQATTPEDNSFFPREKEELPRAGLEPATFCILGRLLYQLSHQGSSAQQAESLKFVQGKWCLSPDKQSYSTSA